jgi:hypothetical protein
MTLCRSSTASADPPYLKSSRNPPPQDYSDFVAAEFQNDQRSMLIVEEKAVEGDSRQASSSASTIPA